MTPAASQEQTARGPAASRSVPRAVVNGQPKDWKEVAEEAILEYFRTHNAEPFHSDELAHLIPDEHRGAISLAVMALVNKKVITGTGGYRKSSIPSRKGSPSQEYRLTELGRDRIAGVTTGVSVSSHCSMGASSDPGDGSSAHGRQRAHDAGESRPIAEPLTLLPEPDPEAWAA
jgi:hypothetical protein